METGVWFMSFVVIVEPDEINAERIRAILESADRDFEYVLASSPEQAVEIAENRKPDVFVSNMDMPVMTGAELFSMIEMISPDTVRVAMTDADKIARTVAFMNECRTFKVILKPCRVADDLISPINAAISYKEMRQRILIEEENADMGLFSTEQDYQKMEQTYKENEKRFARMERVFAELLKDNFALARREPEVCRKLYEWYDWVVAAYFKDMQKGESDFSACVNTLLKAYHCPKTDGSFAITGGPQKDIDPLKMNEMMFLVHLMAEFCRRMLRRYQITVEINTVKNAHILRFLCILEEGWSKKDESVLREPDKRVQNAMFKLEKKCVKAFGYRGAMLYENNEVRIDIAVQRS